MSTMSEMSRVMRSGGLEAQLHQGYDPSFEYKEQSTLFSNVQFGQNQHTPVPILQEILNSVSNLFFDDADLTANNNSGDQNGAPIIIPNMNPSVNGNKSSAETMDLFDGAQGFGSLNDSGNAFVQSNGSEGLPDSAFMNTGVSSLAPSSVSSGPPSNNGDPMLSAPVVTTQPSAGDENQPVNVIISLITDPNPMAVTLVTISGVPLDAMLSAGINNGNGSWTLTPAQLSGLTLTPADGFSGGLGLVVTAQTTLNGMTRFASASVAIVIDSVASTPNLSVQPASGDEGTAIPLIIDASLVDNDGSETLAIVISDVPIGAILSAGIDNGDGSWTLTPAQLVGLTITPPAGSDVDFILTVTAISSENGTTAPVSLDLPVNLNGVATIPNLTVQPASGDEGTAITLVIDASLVDNDGSETLSIVISDVPMGATLSAGIDNGDGSWTLTPAQLVGLTITPVAGSDADFTLTVTAISSENGTTAPVSLNLDVTVDGLATTPNLSVQPATGDEGTAIPLVIDASLVDNDGSEILSIVISDVPMGATLSAGIDNGDGSWTLTPAQLVGLTITPVAGSDADFTLTVTATSSENGTTADISDTVMVTVNGIADEPTLIVGGAITADEDTVMALSISAQLNDLDGSESLSIIISGVPLGATLSAGTYNGNGVWALNPAELVGLTLTPPENFAGDFTLQISAVATEQSGQTTAAQETIDISLTPVADMPVLNTHPADGNEDDPIFLDMQAMLLDLDGSETLSVTISDVPVGAVLSAGIDNGDGSWTLSAADIAGLYILPSYNNADDFVLTIDVQATETNGDIATQSGTLAVTVNAVADIPSVFASNTAGSMNQPININIGGALTDVDGSETISYLITGVPDGFAFSAGLNNGDNSWTFTQAQLVGLQVIPPYDFEGRVHFVARAVSHEIEGDTEQSAAANFHVSVGDADGSGITINLALGIGIAGIGVGLGVGLSLNLNDLNDPNGYVVMEGGEVEVSDTAGLLTAVLGLVSYLTFSGVPSDATFNKGLNLGGGVWRMTVAQLTDLRLTVGEDSATDFSMTFRAHLLTLVTLDLKEIDIHVVGEADIPSVSVGDIAAVEGDAIIPINITAALNDLDGSETLSIVVHGLPSGFQLSAGIDNGNGVWSLTPAQLAGLTLIAPEYYSGNTNFTVTVVATEADGDSNVASAIVNLNVEAVADVPVIAATDFNSNEDQGVLLDMGMMPVDNDGSESIVSIVVAGVPVGASLTHAVDNGDGTWNVDPVHANNVVFTPPEHMHGSYNLSVSVVVEESENGVQNTLTEDIHINIEAQADVPDIIVQDAIGTWDQAIALDISASLNDLDGSEVLSIVIQNVPAGAVLSAGLHDGNGEWILTPDDLLGLTLSPPAEFVGVINLSVTAHSYELSNGHSASSAAMDLSVQVDEPIAMFGMFMMSAMSDDNQDSFDGDMQDAQNFADFIADADAGGMPVNQDHGQAFHDSGQAI